MYLGIDLLKPFPALDIDIRKRLKCPARPEVVSEMS
jgi:hypothetical protein